MRLLADEGVDAAVVARLRSDGHEVVYVSQSSCQASPMTPCSSSPAPMSAFS